jgi:hypothetical protein
MASAVPWVGRLDAQTEWARASDLEELSLTF